MKTEIHPTYNDTTVTCACGNSFAVGSTAKDLHVEVCSACHPFFTGNEKVIDSAGRVEKFKARSAYAKASADRSAAAEKAKADKQAAAKDKKK